LRLLAVEAQFVDVLVGVSVDVDVDGGLDVDVDLNLVATFDVQSILVSMATTPSSRSMPLP
jgi:hypothetical protein